jgi:hypothetical protein
VGRDRQKARRALDVAEAAFAEIAEVLEAQLRQQAIEPGVLVRLTEAREAKRVVDDAARECVGGRQPFEAASIALEALIALLERLQAGERITDADAATLLASVATSREDLPLLRKLVKKGKRR